MRFLSLIEACTKSVSLSFCIASSALLSLSLAAEKNLRISHTKLEQCCLKPNGFCNINLHNVITREKYSQISLCRHLRKQFCKYTLFLTSEEQVIIKYKKNQRKYTYIFRVIKKCVKKNAIRISSIKLSVIIIHKLKIQRILKTVSAYVRHIQFFIEFVNLIEVAVFSYTYQVDLR